MGILNPKVDVWKAFFTEESWANTTSLKANLEIHTIVDDDMEGVLEALDFVGITHNFDDFVLVRF